MVMGTLQVPKNALDNMEVNSDGSMHKLGTTWTAEAISGGIIVKYYKTPTYSDTYWDLQAVHYQLGMK